ncbi:MAG TPA: GNAT family N-acetyltransferase [Candidatus Thermoplasmatota archaeon]|nr:GNAT family N-acetyltransferase [Candidatus Thermoplasmatota archaeon]
MIRAATPADQRAVKALLAFAGLPEAGLESTRLWVLDDGGVVGAVGLKVHGRSALLRSLVVVPSRRGRGEGRLLLNHAIAEARRAGCTQVGALTTTIAPWLARLGWRPTPTKDLPRELYASAELKGACRDTAAAFLLPLAPL